MSGNSRSWKGGPTPPKPKVKDVMVPGQGGKTMIEGVVKQLKSVTKKK